MALRDLVIARREIPFGGSSFSVRGLSTADFSRLLIAHRVDTLAAIERVQTADAQDIAALAEGIAQAAPALVAAAIALAADEPDLAETAAMLPMPVQLEAILAVAELTFTEPGAFPKFLARVTGLLQQAPKLVRATP